jgi:hypothetical protein
MIGPVAHLVALACHFNAKSRGYAGVNLGPTHSTQHFCEYVRFLRRPPDWNGQPDAWAITDQNPDSWLAHQTHTTRRAWLTWQSANHPTVPDRYSAAFVGGGGKWQLHTGSPDRAEVWEGYWRVGNPQAPERRIWQVNYVLQAETAVSPEQAHSLEQIAAEFAGTLDELIHFCEGKEYTEPFANAFRNARTLLESRDPIASVHHNDLAPAGILSQRAQQLLAAAQPASVFGGMGSWNDIGFEGEDQEVYNRLSEALFKVLNEAIRAAANSTAG